ncbi:hypothetical protein KC19_N016200 [Ceratodon purpureus]|nr:hypothetical protein KC19_N016200 [Ceratodon purpureus]
MLFIILLIIFSGAFSISNFMPVADLQFRYGKCWMPLAAEAAEAAETGGSGYVATEYALLPPLDVQWVWYCHCLNPVRYRNYCKSKFGRVIDFPCLVDTPSEEAARNRCKKVWSDRYPTQPFNVIVSQLSLTKHLDEEFHPWDEHQAELQEVVATTERQSTFYYQVSQPYMWEEAFLRVALERYKCFLQIVSMAHGTTLCVPTYDIDLIWHAHQVSPVAYARDTKSLFGCIIDHDDNMERGPHSPLEDGFKCTTKLWENTFGRPYERAGSMYRGAKPVNLPAPPHDGHDGQEILESIPVALSPEFHSPDMNYPRFPLLVPRQVLQVCIFKKSAIDLMKNVKVDAESMFVRLRVVEAHKLLKVDTPVVINSVSDTRWEMLYLLQCEMATVGVTLELRCHVDGCLRTFTQSKLLGSTLLTWEDIQNSPSLSVDTVLTLNEKVRAASMRENSNPPELRFSVSITLPQQGPYLLKTVPDRVTDDTGAMLSNLILRMNKYRPQHGRWITRTVLNHMGRECFVIRIRQAKGIWRKSGDRPVGVDWHERVINICEGGWTYVAGATGYSSVKIVGSAVPNADELDQDRLSWHLNTGLTFVISKPFYDGHDWEQKLEFSLTGSSTSLVRLINGRKLQYAVDGATPEQEGFVTLVRYNAQAPQGRATALFNWQVSAMEVHPEEDVVLVLLLCIATMRSIADFGGRHYGNLFARRRHKEHKPGLKDWNSVVLEHANPQSNLAMWYLSTPEKVCSDDGTDRAFSHAGAMGGACGSSCQAGEGIGLNTGDRGTVNKVSREAIQSAAPVSAWARRTGSGIPAQDYTSKQ